MSTVADSPALPSWHKVSREPPPEGIEVRTIILDEHGWRNDQTLVRKGGLWFLPDMSMYVYYCPTHWRYD